jgi:hypothetical protein
MVVYERQNEEQLTRGEGRRNMSDPIVVAKASALAHEQ